MAWRLLAVLLGLAIWLAPQVTTWHAAAQSSDAQLVIERPLANTTSPTQVEIGGWAADPSAPGPGIDVVEVFLDAGPGAPRSRRLGTASYGHPRPDVVRLLGEARFANTGFSLLVDVPPGTHSLHVYAHTTGAGPDDGWTRAVVPNFEVSLILPGATMVQPGPAVTGTDGSYRTGNTGLQGGRTCLRYTGAGTCDASIPYSVATGAACIQWNNRGQCTGYLPADGVAVPGSGGSTGASSARAPTVAAAPAVPPPAIAVARVAAASPPDQAAGEDPSAAETVPPPAAAAAPPPAAVAADGAAPVRVAAPPGPAAAAAPPPDAVRAVAPPASSADPPRAAASRAPAAAAPAAAPPAASSGAPSNATPVVVVVGGDRRGPVNDADAAAAAAAAVGDSPLATPVPPQILATQAALVSGAGAAAAGVAPLRSGCAQYIGCGGGTPTPGRAAGTGGGTILSPTSSGGAPAPQPVAANVPPSGATAGGAQSALSPEAGGLLMPATGGVPAVAMVATPTLTATPCSPFSGCPGAR